MAEAVPAPRVVRHETAKLRRRRDDRWLAITGLIGALLALPLAQSSWHGPEVAAVLAVSATALLAGQRWAIGLIVTAQLFLIPTVWPRAFLEYSDIASSIVALVTLASMVPGILAMRRAAAALVLVTGRERTPRMCRRFHTGLLAVGVLAIVVPLL
jgi:hypothetical protein